MSGRDPTNDLITHRFFSQHLRAGEGSARGRGAWGARPGRRSRSRRRGNAPGVDGHRRNSLETYALAHFAPKANSRFVRGIIVCNRNAATAFARAKRGKRNRAGGRSSPSRGEWLALPREPEGRAATRKRAWRTKREIRRHWRNHCVSLRRGRCFPSVRPRASAG